MAPYTERTVNKVNLSAESESEDDYLDNLTEEKNAGNLLHKVRSRSPTSMHLNYKMINNSRSEEDKESYDTGSDSEVEGATARITRRRKRWTLSSRSPNGSSSPKKITPSLRNLSLVAVLLVTASAFYLENNAAIFSMITLASALVTWLCLMTVADGQRQREDREFHTMVEMINGLLFRHHRLAKNRSNVFLAVDDVRDRLIPIEERSSKQRVWNRAVQLLEKEESRVQFCYLSAPGEPLKMWRWLPPSSSSEESSTDESHDNSRTYFPVIRFKVW